VQATVAARFDSLPARKMRVEVFDEAGNRYTITLEGRVTRENALRILDMVELLGGMRGETPDTEYAGARSKFDRVRLLVERHFPLVWFSAKDAASLYRKETGDQASLSTVSTYLSRLSRRGVLLRRKDSNKVLYRLMSKGLLELARTPGG